MIASQINLSYHTVNGHVKNIYEKLHVHSGETLDDVGHVPLMAVS